MSGGLRHQNDEKKRPSYLVGYKLADKANHPVKGTQCICTEASSVLELMKFITPNTLIGADVLRDVAKLLKFVKFYDERKYYVLARNPSGQVSPHEANVTGTQSALPVWLPPHQGAPSLFPRRHGASLQLVSYRPFTAQTRVQIPPGTPLTTSAMSGWFSRLSFGLCPDRAWFIPRAKRAHVPFGAHPALREIRSMLYCELHRDSGACATKGFFRRAHSPGQESGLTRQSRIPFSCESHNPILNT
jgi:hypothetical protein